MLKDEIFFGGEIQRTLGFTTSNVSKCCRGKSKLAYGYIWRFKE